MKIYFLFLITIGLEFFNSNVAFAQTEKAVLEISNLPLKDGMLWIAWYSKAEDYEKGAKGKMAYYQKIPVRTQSETKISLDNIQVGEYAIKLFFDENGNGVIDKNAFGIPTEAYGFSNNVYPAMRAASFQEAKFWFSAENKVIKIKMKQ